MRDNTKHCIFEIQYFFDIDTQTKYILRAIRVDESFWTQKQSCITRKIGLEKWCLFFYFVCFSGCHFTKSGLFQKQIGNRGGFFGFIHVSYGNN